MRFTQLRKPYKKRNTGSFEQALNTIIVQTPSVPSNTSTTAALGKAVLGKLIFGNA